MKLLSNMARAECTDFACFSLSRAELVAQAESLNKSVSESALIEINRRIHNRKDKYQDAGIFDYSPGSRPAAAAAPPRHVHSPGAPLDEQELQGIMHYLKIPRPHAESILRRINAVQAARGY
jgi:hypothetical protein